MSTPYHFTPRMPKAPHPTPSSITKVNVSATRSMRPPIQNPYEKFTQPEFDAWIGGITIALKRALGEEPEPRVQETEADPSYNPYSRFLPPEVESEDEGINDSFAEIKARRAVNKKGKARDPREGPGLGGKGAQDKPIEIASSDEEDAEDEKEVELSIAVLEDSESEEDIHTGEDVSWERSSPAVQYTRRNGSYVEGEESSEEYEEYSEEEFDQEHKQSEHSDGDKENEQPHTTTRDVLPSDFIRRPREEEVYILDDDDIEEVIGDQEEQDAEGEVEDEEYSEEFEEEYEEYEEGYEGAEDDEEEPRDRPPSGAANDIIEIEDDDEIEDIQPMENDTSFPPRSSLPPTDVKRQVEIRDPWSGPRSYAQDFYSGGDRIPSGAQADPHNLGPTDNNTVENEDEALDAVDVIQPVDQDTSFPPTHEGPEPLVDIQDPWIGPQTYAEDFYSGGDFRSIHGGMPNPHYISNDDAGYVEQLREDSGHLANEFDISQPLDEDTGFSVRVEQHELPVELPDQWAGPSTYAEDYYAGGDIRVSPDVQIDPSLLSGTAGTGDLEDDIDSFLTPDNASAFTSNERSPVSFVDDDDDDDQVIQPPPVQHPAGVSKSTRGQPIPVDAEIIAIESDDDDDEIVEDKIGENITEEDMHEFDEDIELGYPNFEEDPQYGEEMEGDDELDGDIIVPPTASLWRGEVSPQVMSDVTEKHLDNNEDLSVVDLKEAEIQDNLSEVQPANHTVQSPTPLPDPTTVRESSLFVDMDTPAPEDAVLQNQSFVLPSEVVEPGTTTESSQGIFATETSGESEEVKETIFEASVEETSGIKEHKAPIDTTPDDQDITPENVEQPPVPKEFVLQELTTEVPVGPGTTPIDVNIVDVPVPAQAESDKTDANSMPEAPGNIPEAVGDVSQVDDDIRSTRSVEVDGGKHEFTTEPVSEVMQTEDVSSHEKPSPPLEMPDPLKDGEIEGEIIIERQESQQPEDVVPDQMDNDHAKPTLHDIPEVVEEQKSGGVDGEVEVNEQGSEYLEVVSIASPGVADVDMQEDSFIIEEVQTDGRVSVEPVEREMSLRVESVGPEELTKLQDSTELALPLVEEDISMSQSLIDQDTVSLGKFTDTEESISVVQSVSSPHNQILETGDDSINDASSFLHGLPMPVVANAEVVDPVDPPLTPLFEEQKTDSQTLVPTQSIPAPNPVSFESTSQEEQVREENIEPSAFQPQNTEGVASVQEDIQQEQGSEAAASTSVTDLSFIHATTVLDPMAVAPVFESDPPSITWVNASNNGISTSLPSVMGVALTRNPTVPVLVSDPYPYSLSTPGASLYSVDDVSEDDIALNNSVSSTSTAEKEEKEVVPKNIMDTQVFYVPPQPNEEKRATVKRPSESQNILDNQLFYVPPDATVGQQQEKNQWSSAVPPSHVADVFTNTPISNQPESSKLDEKNDSSAGVGPSKQPSKRKRESTADKLKKANSTPRPRGRPRKNAKVERKVEIPEPTSEETILYKPAKSKLMKTERAHSEASQGSQASSGATLAPKTLKPTSRASSIASSVPSDKSFTGQSSPTVARLSTVHTPNILPPTSLLHAHGAKRKAQAQKISQVIAQLHHRQPPSRTPSLPQISEQLSNNVSTPTPILQTSSAHENFPGSVLDNNGTVSIEAPTATEPSTTVEKPSVVTSTSSTSAPEPATPTSVPLSPSVQVATPPSVAALKASATTIKPTGTPSRHGSISSSPVTRSHCRYHRISLPKEEGGTRICFLVPGCSLNDKKLMEEEEIEDHGDATHEDSLRMVKDIETLGFDLDLIGIIRQLVGLDILREQEVFYLPLPGEEITRKHAIRKTPSEKTAIIRAPGESPNQGSSPIYQASARSPAYNRPPASVADSTSTTFSNLRNVVDHDTDAGQFVTDDANSEDDDEDEPNAKRARPSPPEETGVMGPPTSQTKGKQKSKPRRIDATYQPEEEHDEESDGDLSPKKRRKSIATRGVKRTRTNDAITHGDGNDRQSKKLRAHLSAPQIPSPQKLDSSETGSQQTTSKQEASHQQIGQTQTQSIPQLPEQDQQLSQPLESIPELPPSISS